MNPTLYFNLRSNFSKQFEIHFFPKNWDIIFCNTLSSHLWCKIDFLWIVTECPSFTTSVPLLSVGQSREWHHSKVKKCQVSWLSYFGNFLGRKLNLPIYYSLLRNLQMKLLDYRRRRRLWWLLLPRRIWSGLYTCHYQSLRYLVTFCITSYNRWQVFLFGLVHMVTFCIISYQFFAYVSAWHRTLGKLLYHLI